MLPIIRNAVSAIVKFIGTIHWPTKVEISAEQKQHVHDLLVPHYYIILTHRTNHLSTYFIALTNLILRGKWGYFSHALMNMEDAVNDGKDFRLIQAVGTGVEFDTFDDVFNVQGVALLKPKSMALDEWTAVLDKAKSDLGKPYDTLFDLSQDQKLSCVELVRNALMGEPDYEKNFANFEAMIAKAKYLTPQMFYDCEDFEVLYEVRV